MKMMKMQEQKRKGRNLNENAGMETKAKESKWKRQRKEQKRKEKEEIHNDKEGVETKPVAPKDIKLLTPKLLRPQGANTLRLRRLYRCYRRR